VGYGVGNRPTPALRATPSEEGIFMGDPDPNLNSREVIRMKKLECFVRPEKVGDIKSALGALGIH
jgi:hypothetical protein